MEYIKNLLKDKKIALFVTGSIAIYKSLELIRLFTKAGADVRVVMSDRAEDFISTLSFEALSKNIVLTSKSESWVNENNHIDIGKWADIGVIAPASTNTLNCLANGIANTVFLSSLVAFDKKIITAIATNTKMLNHHASKSSIKLLSLANYIFVNPIEKTLICNDKGLGAMANIEDIFFMTARELLKNEYFANRKAIVTGGGSIEKIDDVRFISNFSSGKMGYYLSLALFLKGADVCFINTANIKSSIFHTINIQSSKEMKEYLDESIKFSKLPTIIKPDLKNDLMEPLSIQKIPFLFMAAAVSDYIPKYPQSGKIKKEMLDKEYNLALIQNIDILSQIDKKDIYTIGFKAEMDKENALENAKKMQKDKELSGVLLNILKNKDSFGSEDMELDFIVDKEITNFKQKHKLLNSMDILDYISSNQLFT